MVFLTPIFLLGLLAGLIPIAIHLIRREKPPKVMFSTIRFLKKTSKKLILFQHLSQILLLLLRSAVIILLVIAFARPLINQSVARLLDADPQSAVILLDLSMSMRYGDNFERAKEETIVLLDSMSQGDEVALVGFSDSAQIFSDLNANLDGVRSSVNGLTEAGFGVTRYLPNLQLADQILEESRYQNRAIYLVSDFQEADLESFEDDWKLAPGTAFFGIDVGAEASRNLTLTDVRSPEQLLEDAVEQDILVRVRSTGTSYVAQGEVSLLVDGQMVDRTLVDLDDRSEEVITFSTAFGSEGAHTGEVRVTGDNFEDDNSHFFTVEVLPKIKVLTVNGESSDNWFDDEGHWFSLAVASATESPFELETLSPEQLSEAALRRNDVVVLLNVGNLNNQQTSVIVEYVKNGGSLLIAPGDQIDPDLFNVQFQEIIPALLEEQNIVDDYSVIADFDRRHPIMRPLETDWSARFERHWRLVPNAEANVVMQFDNSDPALMEREVGEGKVILFASAMDLEWNNLPLQGLFLPFIHETLRHLVQSDLKQRAYSIGDTFSLDISGEADLVSARNPRGQQIVFDNRNYIVEAALPGFIEANVDGESTLFAINPDPEESDFSRRPAEDLFDSIINPDTNPIKSRETQNAQLASELEKSQRIWWWILILVVGLILIESFIANRTYR